MEFPNVCLSRWRSRWGFWLESSNFLCRAWMALFQRMNESPATSGLDAAKAAWLQCVSAAVKLRSWTADYWPLKQSSWKIWRKQHCSGGYRVGWGWRPFVVRFVNMRFRNEFQKSQRDLGTHPKTTLRMAENWEHSLNSPEAFPTFTLPSSLHNTPTSADPKDFFVMKFRKCLRTRAAFGAKFGGHPPPPWADFWYQGRGSRGLSATWSTGSSPAEILLTNMIHVLGSSCFASFVQVNVVVKYVKISTHGNQMVFQRENRNLNHSTENKQWELAI